MLYLIVSSDKQKADVEIAKISGKNSTQRMDAFNFDADGIRGSVGGFSLFGAIESSVTVLNSVSESPENYEILKGLLAGLSGANEKFIVVENDLAKEEVKFFEQAGAKLVELKEEKKENRWGAKDGYNPFAIADAVGRKSAKEAWVEFIRARENNEEAEEIHGRIVGKVRDILLANATTPEESGIHPFVYRKAKSDIKNWPLKDLQNFYDRLFFLYHNSRMGGEELAVALEKELLRI